MQELRALLAQYFHQKYADRLTDVLMMSKDKRIPIVIDGKCGPTGKTTLCRELCRMGFSAVESYESMLYRRCDRLR